MTGADKITAELINGKVSHGPQELDSDGIGIFHITNKDAELVQVVAYKDGMTCQKLYSLSGLTLETE